jgi:hypothetical protein
MADSKDPKKKQDSLLITAKRWGGQFSRFLSAPRNRAHCVSLLAVFY